MKLFHFPSTLTPNPAATYNPKCPFSPQCCPSFNPLPNSRLLSWEGTIAHWRSPHLLSNPHSFAPYLGFFISTFSPADSSVWGKHGLLSSPPSSWTAATFGTTPVWEFGRQILTYGIQLNICLGNKNEFVVHLEMRRRFGLLYLPDNVTTEFMSFKAPISCSWWWLYFPYTPVLGIHCFIYRITE